jgi:hypothetical protein
MKIQEESEYAGAMAIAWFLSILNPSILYNPAVDHIEFGISPFVNNFNNQF